jgi:hypothetical protein
MRRFNIWESPPQQPVLLFSGLPEAASERRMTDMSTVATRPNVTISQHLRSRPRIRRRRRKRAWSLSCLDMLPLFLIQGFLHLCGRRS